MGREKKEGYFGGRGVGKKINFKISIPRDKERRVQITLIISSPISPPTLPISCTPLSHLTFSPLPFLPPIGVGRGELDLYFWNFQLIFTALVERSDGCHRGNWKLMQFFFIFIKNNHFTVYSFVLQSFKYVFGILLKWKKKKTRFILTSLVRYREKTRN